MRLGLLRGVFRCSSYRISRALIFNSANPTAPVVNFARSVSLKARFQPWPTTTMSWSNVLEGYARLSDPATQLPENVHYKSSNQTLTIFDGYEKAKYHFLVLPRDPFVTSDGVKVVGRDLGSLASLLKSSHALEVLESLKSTAAEIVSKIEEEMMGSDGFKWPVSVGFHASESMKHVHLHVISSDLISPKLKNKKHYNSFHTSLGFFLHLDDVISQVKVGSMRLKPTAAYEALLKEPLRFEGEEYKTIPKLKIALEDAWRASGVKAKKQMAQESSSKRKNDELGGGVAKKVKGDDE